MFKSKVYNDAPDQPVSIRVGLDGIGFRGQADLMAKKKPVIKMRSFGRYTKWDSHSKELPKIEEFTTRVVAELDVEFGFIVNIQGAKNQTLDYCIYHPDIPDKDGKPRPPFDGQVYVKTNDWNFYLGDTIWEPVENKLGTWTMTLELDGKRVAEKSFELVAGIGPMD